MVTTRSQARAQPNVGGFEEAISAPSQQNEKESVSVSVGVNIKEKPKSKIITLLVSFRASQSKGHEVHCVKELVKPAPLHQAEANDALRNWTRSQKSDQKAGQKADHAVQQVTSDRNLGALVEHSANSVQLRRSARVKSQLSALPDTTSVKEATAVPGAASCFITLKLPRRILVLKYKKQRGRYALVPKSYRVNDSKFRFGHNPLWHRGFAPPSPQACQVVFDTLAAHHKNQEGFDAPLTAEVAPLSMEVELERPTHAAVGITVDSIVKVIFSQSTANPTAIRQHTELCKTFTYDVNGAKVRGKVPNYHKIRLLTQPELERHLVVGGLYKIRAESILAILNAVYEKNRELLRLGDDAPVENEVGAADFVPGMLSLDFLNEMNKDQLMHYLTAWRNVGVKTAACILAFNFRLNVFAVDTHVLQEARLLEWVPEDCEDADQACMFLDKFIPDGLKYGLHQIFWHHRQSCIRCKYLASDDRKPLTWETAFCPIENYCNRNISKLAKRGTKRPSTSLDIDEFATNDDAEPETERRLPKMKRVRVTKATKVTIGAGNEANFDSNTEPPSEEKVIRQKKTVVAVAQMKPDKAEQQGYVLTVETHDDDFGVSGRTTSSVVWMRSEMADINDVITVDEAKQRGLIKTDLWKKTKRVKTLDTKQSLITSFTTSVVGSSVTTEISGSIDITMTTDDTARTET